MDKISRLIKKIAEESKFDDKFLKFILDNMSYETNSDDEIGISITGKIGVDKIQQHDNEFSSTDVDGLLKTLQTDSYVSEYFEDVANDSKGDNIKSFNMPALKASCENNTIKVIAEIDDVNKKSNDDDEDVNDDSPNDYHNQKDFV